MTKWCPQHGYPEPCAKCNGMTKEEWDRFFESLARAVGVKEEDSVHKGMEESLRGEVIDRGSFAKYVEE